nr:hypothetical protein CFP56_72990 [Quercus suber]
MGASTIDTENGSNLPIAVVSGKVYPLSLGCCPYVVRYTDFCVICNEFLSSEDHDYPYSQIAKLYGDIRSSCVSARGRYNIDSRQCRAFIASHRPGNTETALISTAETISKDRLHVLMPASDGNINLCKTLMTAHILGYPKPTLIAWNEKYDAGNQLGGGSHMAKISRTLDHLNSMDASLDDDLVIMIDAYDIWFQLRPEVLISRYYAINAKANKSLRQRLGRAVDEEGIRQTIIFGAGKRCAPNQLHTIACYPLPDSPIPMDVYGSNTDTPLGRNHFTSKRQRYLNSGYIIGPLRDMRAMFKRAHQKVVDAKDHADWDSGSTSSWHIYGGSDQSVFNTMLGEQEYQREVMRRRHLSSFDRLRGLEKPTALYFEGIRIEDPLNPPFTHEPGQSKEGRPDEFGMGLDYFSDLGQQTMNADEDSRYISHDRGIESQVKQHGLFECTSRVTAELPEDIRSSPQPFEAIQRGQQMTSWSEVPLFTNVCLNSIPVMIHRNGDKQARVKSWPKTWMVPQGRQLMEDVLKSEGQVEIAYSQGNTPEPLEWRTLCPLEYEAELFRDRE